MPNITLSELKGRGYDIHAFEKRVVNSGASDDWWILEENWHRLVRDLRAVRFEIKSSRKLVPHIINGVDKDLPAHAVARFPGPTVTPECKSVNFFRVSGKTKSALQWLAEEVNGVTWKESRGQRWCFFKSFCCCLFKIPRGSEGDRLIKGSFSYGHGDAVARVASTKLPLYTRSVFETEFDLIWNLYEG